MKKNDPIDVAVGILMKDNGDILLAERPAGKPYEGYWEFPGGKVEAGETIEEALKREFMEELGIAIASADPWCGVEFVYPHAHVRLHFYISHDWKGVPQSREGRNSHGGIDPRRALAACNDPARQVDRRHTLSDSVRLGKSA